MILFYEQWYYVFSNFSPHAVEIGGVRYATSEHAYQAAKCTDPQGKAEIIAAKSPLQTKHISNKKYRHARDPEWDDKKLSVMESILRAKLEQHQEVHEALIRSGNEEIAEDSPVDYFWGRGTDGTGQNHLGKLWMKIRAELI